MLLQLGLLDQRQQLHVRWFRIMHSCLIWECIYTYISVCMGMSDRVESVCYPYCASKTEIHAYIYSLIHVLLISMQHHKRMFSNYCSYIKMSK